MNIFQDLNTFYFENSVEKQLKEAKHLLHGASCCSCLQYVLCFMVVDLQSLTFLWAFCRKVFLSLVMGPAAQISISISISIRTCIVNCDIQLPIPQSSVLCSVHCSACALQSYAQLKELQQGRSITSSHNLEQQQAQCQAQGFSFIFPLERTGCGLANKQASKQASKRPTATAADAGWAVNISFLLLM